MKEGILQCGNLQDYGMSSHRRASDIYQERSVSCARGEIETEEEEEEEELSELYKMNLKNAGVRAMAEIELETVH